MLMPMKTIAATLFIALAWPAQASAFELSGEEERNVQIAAMSTGYAFGALQTVLWARAFKRGEPLHRSWVAGTILSSISIAGMHSGYIVLASDTNDPDRKASYEMASVPGLMLGGAHLGIAIDSIQRGDGGFWMDRPEAAVTLVHGAALSSFGSVLIAGANPGSSDLSKIPPIYTWAVSGAIVVGYSLLSLILR
jgi:hypothetical protein